MTIKIIQVPETRFIEIGEKDPTFMIRMFLGGKISTEEILDYYKLAWEGDVGTDDLDEIFEIFNMKHPVDYNKRSLSCGDIVATKDGLFICKMIGWERLPDNISAPAGNNE